MKVSWDKMAKETPDVFGMPEIAPQGLDGVAHFNYYDAERLLSFQWNGHLEQHVTVSHGGYGEPVKWTFNFMEFWRMPDGIGAQYPVFQQGEEMFAAAYHFERACNHWISRWEQVHENLV